MGCGLTPIGADRAERVAFETTFGAKLDSPVVVIGLPRTAAQFKR